VTVALGEAGEEDVALVIALVDRAVKKLEPFTMRFGPIARETVTGRYVLADISIDATVQQWRHRLRERVSGHLSGLGRMTDEPHLTVAVVEDHHEAVDRILDAWDAGIADCRVTRVDVAYAGARGAKRERIQRFRLGGA
jgi:DNA-binding FrmR family transcriptional regulator